ncbi:ABC transporter permease [Haloplanus sp.]|uniref:ABC transporter permease n=1 Tax=Haloplanus sp. TaxID=1961696 RepID=UPI0026088E1F|nr:ABC transporter permease [Haloplanus sp.]
MSGLTDRSWWPSTPAARGTVADAGLAALPTALAVALGVVPLGFLFVESVSPPVTLTNYAALGGSVYPDVMLRSLGIGVVITGICLTVAYPVTYWLAHRCPARYRLALLVSFTLPLWLNYVVLNYTWVWILAENGLVNVLLTETGLADRPLDLLRGGASVVVGPFALPSLSLGLGFVHIYLPYVLLTMYVSMERLDYRQVEAARDLGAGPVRVFRDIIVPETYGGAVAGALIVYARIAGAFATPQILAAPSEQLIAQVITAQFYDVLNYPFAAALSVAFLAIVLVGFGIGALSSDVRAELGRW